MCKTQAHKLRINANAALALGGASIISIIIPA
jgi:hypothetical protein